MIELKTKEDVYLEAIKAVGAWRDWELPQEQVDTFRTAWEALGTGWPTEQVDYTPDGEKVIVRAYYGSSSYDSRRMSRLIDSVVQDCKAVGVETLPPEKLAAMMADYKAVKFGGAK